MSQLTPTPEFRNRTMQAIEWSDAGAHERAEDHFTAMALAAHREGQPANEFFALRLLSTLFGRTGRFFEAYVVARQRIAIAESHGSDADHASACLLAAHALSAESMDEMAAPLLDRIEKLRAEDPQALAGRLCALGQVGVSVALRRGDASGARTYLELIRNNIAPDRNQEEMNLALAWNEARILLMEGRPEAVAPVLDAVSSLQSTQASIPIGLADVRMHAALALRDLHAAREHADALLALLVAAAPTASAVAHVSSYGRELAVLYRAPFEDCMAEERALDLAADAVLRRMQQIDRCIRRMPEMGSQFAAASRELIEFRRRFTKDYHEVLQRVARLLEQEDRWLARVLQTADGMEDFIAICAWCERVRAAGGDWIPIGEAVPRTGPFPITHGICPSCSTVLTEPVTRTG